MPRLLRPSQLLREQLEDIAGNMQVDGTINDRTAVLEQVKRTGSFLELAPPHFAQDPEMLTAALRTWPDAIELVRESGLDAQAQEKIIADASTPAEGPNPVSSVTAQARALLREHQRRSADSRFRS